MHPQRLQKDTLPTLAKLHSSHAMFPLLPTLLGEGRHVPYGMDILVHTSYKFNHEHIKGTVGGHPAQR